MNEGSPQLHEGKLQPLTIGSLTLDPPVVMAPMAGFSDRIFRDMVRGFGGCPLMFTEMVSAEGLLRGGRGSLELLPHPDEFGTTGVQLFGFKPERVAEAAAWVEDRGVKLVDINMGCPARKVVVDGSGAALLKDPERAVALVAAVRKKLTIPLTVKLRLGWGRGEVTVHELAPRLVDAGADAVTLHARCRNEGFSGEAKWEHIRRLKEALPVPLLGNGDARTAGDVFRMAGETGCDGVMVGRAGLAKPWLFSQAAALNRGEAAPEPDKEVRRKLILEHFRRLLADESAAPHRAVHRIRGFVAWYSRGLNGGALLRRAVNRAPDADEFVEIVNTFFDQGHVS